MYPKSFSMMWASAAPAVADHLWQSTLFVVIAGLLTLLLRKNHARARYWLWLAASVKFLIPFAWLVAIGRQLVWLRGSADERAGLSVAIQQVSQPFTQPVTSGIAQRITPIASAGVGHMLLLILAGVWLCGFASILLVWCVRWRRMSAAIQASTPLVEGREVETLRRLELAAGIGKRVEMLLSQAMLEPGIFGIARPVLLWPAGISQHLEEAHLEAIVAHELCHVCRRDNLAAALHMLVEALFWFHPLVWWVGARLVEERERACDERVVELGSERRIYAESILKVCEFCVGSSLACVAGVTGADLKKRMVHIMSQQVARKLDFTRKVLLSVAGLLAIAAPIGVGLANAIPSQAQSQTENMATAAPAFESVSIKPSEQAAPTPTYAGGGTHMMRMMYTPDGFTAADVTLQTLIQEAYGVQADQIAGGPDWLNSARFDIDAKVGQSDTNKFGSGPNRVESQRMLQAALADQTKLVLHRETKELPIYALVVADGGPKLQPDKTAESAGGIQGPSRQVVGVHRMQMQMGSGQVVGMSAQGVSLADFAEQLSRQLGTPVIDKTGLTGSYDFNLRWTADASHSNSEAGNTPVAGPSESLLTAIQGLGLRLEPQKAPMEILVIDHVEKPAEN